MKQTIMRMLLHFLSVLLAVFTILVLIQGQDQSGFISLDCGLPEILRYSAIATGINYISDAKYIDSGVSQRVAPTNVPVLQQLNHLRSFPSGVRNCYRINLTSGTKYLIRASFDYANYDNLNKPPQFDLHLGANVWDTVKIEYNESFFLFEEIIYTPSRDYIQLCLVNTGNGTPFISAIELRPLNNTAYVTYSPKSVLLIKYRIDLGSTQGIEDYRFKDDFYDRIWYTNELTTKLPSDVRRLNTSINNDDLVNNGYKLPAIVMSTAVTPVNASAPLEFYFDVDNVNDQYYFYFYFTELEKLAENETRVFSITVNGILKSGSFRPRYSIANTLYSQVPSTGAKRYTVTLFKTENSTLPPILNAFEVYKAKDFSQSETQQEDVDTITKIQKVYGVTRNWKGDPCGPVKYMWEGLNCSIDDSNSPPRITSLNLSSSGLTGQLVYSISKLTMLQFLDLSNNSLDGPIPDFLMQLPSLKVLNLKKNKLAGLVPSKLLERSRAGSLSLSLDDNPGLCVTESCSRKKNFFVPLMISFSILFVIFLISLGFWIFRRQKVTSSKSMKMSLIKSKHQAFSYNEIINITNNFQTIIGEGGFGKVYVGVLQNQTQVAVKMLSPSSMQGYKEFQSEAQLLMIVHHRNLVSLIGYCDEGEIKALVYEYMVNGNLQQHLQVENSNILKWNERLYIAIDVAQGLEYLHNGCKPPIIHRDLKPSNILLDENMHAKIADFGLCRAFSNDVDSHITTRPAGTIGYIDPEFQRTRNANKKNDVYSFGIILFVLITGRQAIVRVAEEYIHIRDLIIPIVEEGDIQNVVDPRLHDEFNINSAWKAIEIAMSCTSPNGVERPDMSQVLVDLKECLSLLDMVQRDSRGTRVIDEVVSLATLSETNPSPR